MLGIIVILIITIYMAFFFPIIKKKPEEEPTDTKSAAQVKKLWTIAQVSMRERKPMRAEKALLAILKFDEKNAAAYNRLGILYAKSQKFDEAIECFEIAQSLDNNASSLHNVGLIYLETGAYEKAAMAFRQALELEGDLPARYLALAKAEEKMGNRKNAIEALETAFELEHSVSTLRQILAIHEAADDTEAIAATTARIEEQITENTRKKELLSRSKRMVRRPMRMQPRAAVKPVAKKLISHPAPANIQATRQTSHPTSASTQTKPASRSVTVTAIRPAAKTATKTSATQPATRRKIQRKIM